VASFCAWRYEKPAHWVGIPAAADPRQSADGLPAAFAHEGYTIKPLARYAVKAVVLSRDRYRFDPGAKIAPVDLALGWGPMSVADVINELQVSQSGRFYEYAWKDEPPLDPAQIITHSANTHCLPKDDKVRRELLAVKRHDLVTLEGLLVEVQGPNNYRWRSSLTRDDTRGGACEVLWVTSVKRQRL
jgi:hypothetical protein